MRVGKERKILALTDITHVMIYALPYTTSD